MMPPITIFCNFLRFSSLIVAWVALACGQVKAAPEQAEGAVSFFVARAELLKEGWQPRETYGVFPDGLRWNEDGDAGTLYKAGIEEVEACSSTLAHQCSFNYVRGGKCLVLHTQGKFEPGIAEPVVIRRSPVCPRPELTAPAQAASR